MFGTPAFILELLFYILKFQVVIYGWFEFIIDAGSSLGLWLGLSALGIWDFIVEYTRKINSFFKYK